MHRPDLRRRCLRDRRRAQPDGPMAARPTKPPGRRMSFEPESTRRSDLRTKGRADTAKNAADAKGAVSLVGAGTTWFNKPLHSSLRTIAVWRADVLVRLLNSTAGEDARPPILKDPKAQ